MKTVTKLMCNRSEDMANLIWNYAEKIAEQLFLNIWRETFTYRETGTGLC